MSSNQLYDRISRDPALGELRDGPTRLFLMRADAFMDAFQRLDDDARYTMFAAFARSIAEHSGQSVKYYRHELGPAAREIFLNAAINLAADMGWGAWAFGPHTPGEITLVVRNSPFVEGYRAGGANGTEGVTDTEGASGIPVCAPILGLAEALGGIVFSVDPDVEEIECAAVTGGDTCRFVARMG
jgi:hypothetical protein